MLKARNINDSQQLSTLDREGLEILEQLRKQNRLLGRDFSLLEELATPDALAQAQ